MRKLYTLLLFILFLIPSKSNSTDFIPEQLICQLLPEENIDAINSTYSTTTIVYLPTLDIYLLQTESGADAQTLADLITLEPTVLLCEPNYIFDTPEGVQASQPFLDLVASGDYQTQTAAVALQLEQVQTTSTGTGVKVAVIDVGVNLTHPQLAASTTSGFDYVSNDPIANDEAGGVASGHGTFVAGIIHLVAPESEIISYRVLDTTGRGNGFSVTEAILNAVDDGCKVINLSMVMDVQHASLDLAIEYARNNDVMVIAAAGNDSVETDKFPFRDSYTLGVAAVDSNNVIADFSNFGGKVDICAPGTQIYAPFLDSSYAWWDGTSFATPFVAGQAALLFAKNPGASWNDIKEAITLSAISINDVNPGFEGKLGDGLIDLSAALNMMSPFICGDVNNDSEGPDISDIVFMVSYMFGDGLPPIVINSMNVDGLGGIDISDLVHFINFSFNNGSALNCP